MKTWGLRGTRGGLNPQPPDKSSTVDETCNLLKTVQTVDLFKITDYRS